MPVNDEVEQRDINILVTVNDNPTLSAKAMAEIVDCMCEIGHDMAYCLRPDSKWELYDDFKGYEALVLRKRDCGASVHSYDPMIKSCHGHKTQKWTDFEI
ncbi:hypothetical protein NQ318_012369 [Aromia moschata]|uniref:Uncharacterized protein n=1 Tax=Aromia moschata TaxID=1265417 RepID=A0AAV8Y459_9CUCU|nr:hypothetical protein NQ318_012369 [Aromia moschata]